MTRTAEFAAGTGRGGQCYRLAGRHLLENESHEGVLVHGSASLDGGPRLSHAWVDEGRHIGVYEPENDQHFSQAEFKKRFAPVEHVRIERGAAVLQATQSGHWGPWR